MLFRKKSIILLIIILLKVTYCYSQWTPTNGPYGTTTVLSIISHDSLVLTSTGCGYFSKKSINNVWDLNSTLTFSGYTKIGDSLFIGGSNFKWIDLSNPNNPPTTINPIPLTTLSNSDTCLYGGSLTSGFFKSSDYGITWNSKNEGLPADTNYIPFPPYVTYNYKVNSIEVTTNHIFCGTSKGVYRNTGILSTWIPFNSGLPLSNVTFIKSFDDTLFTAIGNSIYQSADLGNNWTLFFSSTSSITSILKFDNQYFVGSSNNGIFYSSDNGLTWNAINSGLSDLNVTALSLYDSTLLCGTNSTGVYFLQNGQWQRNEVGMICSSIRSMAITSTDLILNDETKVYKLDSNGTWLDVSPNLTYEMFSSLASMNDTVFLSVENDSPSWPFDNPFIVFSPDKGITWNSLISPVPFARDDPYRIYCGNGRLYAYEDEIMYYTANLGISWSNISLPSPFCNMFNDFIIKNSLPYAASCGNGQVVKLDSQNWVLANNGLPTDREPLALASCDNALFAYISVYGMYVSFDDGNNWTNANNGLDANYSIRDFVNSGSNLFVTTDFGVYSTTDFGQNWVAINNGLKNLNTGSIKILNDTLYVGTYGNGVWKQSINDINLHVQGFQQAGNSLRVYPNPASEYIHVATNLINAKFSIFDMVGNEVRSGSLNSKFEINTSGIKCGAYIVLLQSDTAVLTTKLLINR